MANSGDESESIRGRAGMVIDAVSGVIVDAKGVVTPLPKAAVKELRKLEKGLAAARKTESKRLRQVAAAAHGPEAGAEIAKRRKQAEDAASEVATLASRIAAVATSAAGSACWPWPGWRSRRWIRWRP